MDLQVGFEQRLALLGGEQLGDLGGVLGDAIARVVEQRAAILGRRLGPVGKGLLGGLDGLLDVGRVAEWDAVDHLAGGRVADVVGALGR